ncbi:ecto-ADP-ribosyltransferase 5-like [Neoarius graeffei]|uniref:ecto-ADP-ribosyltransferase 5-like n=1 Tax=Neoarius graeffei TaxID=443677 RepID=UPI00298C066F|nr:ecto-ADP-ribosyltransferase 5-like [Neoarius graeffei]
MLIRKGTWSLYLPIKEPPKPSKWLPINKVVKIIISASALIMISVVCCTVYLNWTPDSVIKLDMARDPVIKLDMARDPVIKLDVAPDPVIKLDEAPDSVIKLDMARDPVIKLDMAPDSVDDQFIGCENKTYNLIRAKILPQELNSNKKFKEVWENYPNAPDNFTRIIKVYTNNSDLYSWLNSNVSSGRNTYKSNFRYKAFHFLLTRAIQMRKGNKCTNVFRRTSVHFEKKVLGHEMRFGRFASTSLKNLYKFGNISCFKIKTCFGADISKISVFPDEKEVLVPPYEKFKITNITKNQMNCNVLYTLESTGECSNMNCELVK